MKIIPAPIAGWTDYAFRQILCDCGAREVWTEMISATALYMKNEKTEKMLRPVEGKVYQVVQLFGNNPEHFAPVILSGVLDDYDEINLNMGCPAPKIVKNGSGCKLMVDISKAKDMIAKCREATKKAGKNLSVKFRLGWDKNNSIEFAKMCEDLKVDRIIVHGRLGVDGYRGVADYAAIAEIKKAVSVPLIANGDVKNKQSLEKCLEVTKADGVMVGRALFGAPWKIKMDDKNPNKQEIQNIMEKHIKLHDGNPSALNKQLLYYNKYIKAADRQ